MKEEEIEIEPKKSKKKLEAFDNQEAQVELEPLPEYKLVDSNFVKREIQNRMKKRRMRRLKILLLVLLSLIIVIIIMALCLLFIPKKSIIIVPTNYIKAKDCSRLVPGWSSFSEFPMKIDVKGYNGFKNVSKDLPLFNSSIYLSCKTISVEGETYRIPDFVNLEIMDAMKPKANITSIYTDSYELWKSRKPYLSQVNFSNFGIDYKGFPDFQNEKRANILITNFDHQILKFRFETKYNRLNSGFLEDCRRLPLEYDNEKYQIFLDKYGEFFTLSGWVGGRISYFQEGIPLNLKEGEERIIAECQEWHLQNLLGIRTRNSSTKAIGLPKIHGAAAKVLKKFKTFVAKGFSRFHDFDVENDDLFRLKGSNANSIRVEGGEKNVKEKILKTVSIRRSSYDKWVKSLNDDDTEYFVDSVNSIAALFEPENLSIHEQIFIALDHVTNFTSLQLSMSFSEVYEKIEKITEAGLDSSIIKNVAEKIEIKRNNLNSALNWKNSSKITQTCNDRGVFFNSKCHCKFPYYGSNCNDQFNQSTQAISIKTVTLHKSVPINSGLKDRLFQDDTYFSFNENYLNRFKEARDLFDIGLPRVKEIKLTMKRDMERLLFVEFVYDKVKTLKWMNYKLEFQVESMTNNDQPVWPSSDRSTETVPENTVINSALYSYKIQNGDLSRLLSFLSFVLSNKPATRHGEYEVSVRESCQNMVGVAFHYEKSSKNGLDLLSFICINEQ